MSLAELKKHVRSAKTESSEKNAVIKHLRKLGHRTIPSVSSHKNGKYTVRIYLWKNTPIGDLALMAGPSLEGDLHSVVPVVGDVHAEDVLLYVPKKGSQPAYAAFRTGKGPSAQAIANTAPARRRARFSATSPSYDFGKKASRSRSNRRGRRNPIDTDKVKRAYKDYVAALEEIVEAAEAQGLGAETSRVCPNGVIYWTLGPDQAKELAEGSPFRAPHHTASARAMEEEVSLAQGGILYLDGIEKYSRSVIASLASALRKQPNVVVLYAIEFFRDLERRPNYATYAKVNEYRKMLGVSPLHPEESTAVLSSTPAGRLVELIQEVKLHGDEASALDAIDAAATPVLGEAYRLEVAGGRSWPAWARRKELVDELKMKVHEYYNEWSDSGGGSVAVEEVEEGWERHFEPGSYLYNFFKEKDIPEVTFTPTDSTGEKHFIPNEVVVEHIAKTYGSERTQIEDTLRKIDFANGDVNHFLEHLAGAIAEKYVKFAPPGQVGPEPVEDFDADLARELEALMGEEEAPPPVEAAPAPPAGSPASQGTGELTPADLREKLRKRRAAKRESSAPKTMEEEMLEVMGLNKNPRRRRNTRRGRSARRRGGYRSNPALGGKARTTIIAYITRQGHGDVAEGVVEAVNTAVKDRDESPAEIAKLIMQHVPKLVEVYKRRAAEAVPEPAVVPVPLLPGGRGEVGRLLIEFLKEPRSQLHGRVITHLTADDVADFIVRNDVAMPSLDRTQQIIAAVLQEVNLHSVVRKLGISTFQWPYGGRSLSALTKWMDYDPDLALELGSELASAIRGSSPQEAVALIRLLENERAALEQEPGTPVPAGKAAGEADAEIKRRIIAKIKEAQAAGQEIRPVGPAAAAPQEAAAPSWIKPGARAFQTAHPEYGTWILERDSHGQWNAKKAYPGSGSIATSVSDLVEFWKPGDAPAAAPTRTAAPSPSTSTPSSGKLTPEDFRAKLAERRRKKRAAKKNPRRRTRRY